MMSRKMRRKVEPLSSQQEDMSFVRVGVWMERRHELVVPEGSEKLPKSGRRVFRDRGGSKARPRVKLDD